MPNVLINGANLYYAESGIGDPLVLVHGTGGNADVWAKIVPALATTHRTIAYDRRAYQRSSGPSPATKDFHHQHGEDLGELLQVLHAQPATVVAWSAGAFAALHAALAYPDRIKQLVLYEPPLHAKTHITWPLFRTFALVGLSRIVGRPQAGAEAFARAVMAYADGRNSFDGLSSEIRVKMAQDTPALLAELAAGTGEELRATTLSTQIKVPLTLMVGEQSPALFLSAMQRLRNIFPQAPLVTIRGGNHFAHLDEPEAFVRALRAAIAA